MIGVHLGAQSKRGPCGTCRLASKVPCRAGPASSSTHTGFLSRRRQQLLCSFVGGRCWSADIPRVAGTESRGARQRTPLSRTRPVSSAICVGIVIRLLQPLLCRLSGCDRGASGMKPAHNLEAPCGTKRQTALPHVGLATPHVSVMSSAVFPAGVALHIGRCDQQSHCAMQHEPPNPLGWAALSSVALLCRFAEGDRGIPSAHPVRSPGTPCSTERCHDAMPHAGPAQLTPPHMSALSPASLALRNRCCAD